MLEDEKICLPTLFYRLSDWKQTIRIKIKVWKVSIPCADRSYEEDDERRRAAWWCVIVRAAHSAGHRSPAHRTAYPARIPGARREQPGRVRW